MGPFISSQEVLELGEDIYAIENFLTQEECQYFKDLFDKGIEANGHNLELGFGVVSNNFEEIEKIRDRIKSIIDPVYELGHNTAVNLMKVGNSWGLHYDAQQFEPIRGKANQKDPLGEYDLVKDSKYGTVLYFNEFGGGALNYPLQNIQYKPMPGTLVVHSSEKICSHEVLEVTEGYRYSYSNHLSIPILVPRNL